VAVLKNIIAPSGDPRDPDHHQQPVDPGTIFEFFDVTIEDASSPTRPKPDHEHEIIKLDAHDNDVVHEISNILLTRNMLGPTEAMES
jgi:hypothetical protein